ncbi:MAG: mechanosensitive ion channel family protein, partial [Devosiaceae bacterium]|nr:mechanosensitive ion channel family protein [Devosiaceae bacterium MH13]
GLAAAQTEGEASPPDVDPAAVADLVPTPPDEATQQQFNIWSQLLDLVDSELEREQLSLDALAGLRDQVDGVRTDVDAFIAARAGALAEEQALLAATTADADLVETPQMRAQRQRILDLEALLQPAELISGRANSLREQVVARRSDEFAARLFQNTTSIVAPSLWAEGLSGLPALFTSVRELTVNSVQSVRARATPAAFAGLGLLVGFLLLLSVPFRLLALKRAQRRADRTPNDLEKAVGALRIVLLSAGIPAIGFAVLLVGLGAIGGLSLRAQTVLDALVLNITLYFLGAGFARAYLAPALPAWRLVPVGDGFAARATNFLRLAVLAYVVGETLRSMASAFVSPLAVVQVLEALPVLAAGLAIIAACRSLIRGLDSSQDSENRSMIHILWRWTLPIAAVASLVSLAALLFGYLALAAFIIDRLVWTAVVLAALHLGALLIEATTNAAFQEGSRASTWVHDNIGLSPSGLGQFGVLISGLVKLILILIASALIIAPFGVETNAFRDIVRGVFTGIEVAGFSFSLTSVLLAFALVGIGIVVTRGVQGWLENRYLPRTGLDAGLKASIRTGVGYIGIIIAASIGLSYLGLDLENIALVAGALSVGIGFGLQSIVSNFVSGVILLAERPFKPGDWIVVGDEQGIVKRINVRGTEIQTFDRATVLIPNSDFISGTVKNRVHRDTLGRIDIPVGVGYDSEPEKVREILLEVANAHPMTLSFPEPAAFFIEFGASSLDFMLFAYLADVGNGYGVKSDLRFEIFKRFREEGIEIPFAQSDVTIRNLDEVLEALAASGVAKAEKAGELEASAATKTSGVRAVPFDRPLADPRTSQLIDPDGDGLERDPDMPEDGPSGGR